MGIIHVRAGPFMGGGTDRTGISSCGRQGSYRAGGKTAGDCGCRAWWKRPGKIGVDDSKEKEINLQIAKN